MKLTVLHIYLISIEVILCGSINFYFMYSILIFIIICICICVYGVCMCASTCEPWLICGGHRTISDVVLASILFETVTLFTAVCARLSRP